MMHLPEDLLCKVLSRLPVKSLLRFRCVSKLWLSPIDGSYLIKLQLNHTRQNSNGLLFIGANHVGEFNDRSNIMYTLDFDNGKTLAKAKSKKLELSPDIPYLNLLDSCFVQACNGLICLFLRDTNQVIIWNPATHRHREVPQQFGTLCLQYGFGYDYKNEDYKLVMVEREEELKTYCTRVYSLKSNSWGAIRRKDGLGQLNCPVNVGGAIHYVSLEQIFAFDLATEEWRMVPIPPGPVGNTILIYLSNHHESLNVSWYDMYSNRVDFWVMNNSVSWSKLFTIEGIHDDITGLMSITHVWSLKKTSQQKVLVHDTRGLMLYNIDKGVEVHRAFEVPVYFNVITCYYESLVRV